MRSFGLLGPVLAALDLAKVAAAPPLDVGHHMGRSRYGAGLAAYRRSSFDPVINRHTGKPHEHKREIARRLRQAGAA
jgi:hypothetical protein